MKFRWIHTLAALGLAAMAATSAAQAKDPTLEPMPAPLETRFALSAAPPALRERATVYLLDTQQGYRLARQGTNGVACVVERTLWELADFRDDLYVPLCYDAAGSKTYLKFIMDTAALRAQGMNPAALKAEVEKRFRDKTYRPPTKPGLSYMVAPIMRVPGPPDMQVHTMAMPHLMFYAPYLTNDDIAAAPDLGARDSLRYPFIDRQGNAEQSYMIQAIGDTEKAKILSDEKTLVAELCAYRDVLCLDGGHH